MKRKQCWVVVAIVLALLPGCATFQQDDKRPKVSFTQGEPPPQDALDLWQRAEKEWETGNADAAVRIWENIAKSYPENGIAARAFHRLGNFYLERNEPARALEYYDYLLYTYPGWEGENSVRVDRLEAFWKLGKGRRVFKEADVLWEAIRNDPEAQARLGNLMVFAHGESGDIQRAFGWATAAFAKAQTDEQKKMLARTTLELLNRTDEGEIRRLLETDPSPFMAVFLEYRLAQLEMERNPSGEAQDRLSRLLQENATHPLALEMQASLREAPSKVILPLNPERVGCLVPLNGSYGKYGSMVLRGLTMAIEDWNRMQPGQPVTLVVKDTHGEAEAATRAFEELAKEDGVLAVIGPLGSLSAKAVAPVANEWGVPLLTLTQRDEKTVNPFVLNIFLDNREMIRSLVRYCTEQLGYSRFAALYPSDRYGQNLSELFAEAVRESGGKLLASVPYKGQTTDFREPIHKLMNQAKKSSPTSGLNGAPFEALFLPDQVKVISLLAPQLPYYNVVGVTLLGTNLWGEGPLAQAGGPYVDQAIFPSSFFADSQYSMIRTFSDNYRSIYRAPPSYLEAQAYDAMMLFLQARYMAYSSQVQRSSLLQNLLQIRDYSGLTGNCSFTPRGDLQREYLILQVKNGGVTQVFP